MIRLYRTLYCCKKNYSKTKDDHGNPKAIDSIFDIHWVKPTPRKPSTHATRRGSVEHSQIMLGYHGSNTNQGSPHWPHTTIEAKEGNTRHQDTPKNQASTIFSKINITNTVYLLNIESQKRNHQKPQTSFASSLTDAKISYFSWVLITLNHFGFWEVVMEAFSPFSDILSTDKDNDCELQL